MTERERERLSDTSGQRESQKLLPERFFDASLQIGHPVQSRRVDQTVLRHVFADFLVELLLAFWIRRQVIQVVDQHRGGL